MTHTERLPYPAATATDLMATPELSPPSLAPVIDVPLSVPGEERGERTRLHRLMRHRLLGLRDELEPRSEREIPEACQVESSPLGLRIAPATPPVAPPVRPGPDVQAAPVGRAHSFGHPVLITTAHGRHDHLIRQRALLRTFCPGLPHLIVAIWDGQLAEVLVDDPDAVVLDYPRGEPMAAASSSPQGLPLCAARNFAASQATAMGADLLVFIDVDCLPTTDVVAALGAHCDPYSIVCGPVTYLARDVLPSDPTQPLDPAWLDAKWDPHPSRPAPAAGEVVHVDPERFWPLLFAMTPAAWQRLGGYDPQYHSIGCGTEDLDFATHAASLDMRISWVGDARACHQPHANSTPTSHIEELLENAQHFYARWGRWPTAGWLESLSATKVVEYRNNTWLRVAADTGSLPIVKPLAGLSHPKAT